MLCLGIESSCDDTGLALVRDGTVTDSILSSQVPVHAIFGGVVPELASRQHYRHITALYDELMSRNSILPQELDIIAVTRGPGLLGSLLVGTGFAKALAFVLQKPVIGINHLHAHLLACEFSQKLCYPCLGLVVSGGHTELYRMESPYKMIRLGRTLDDAAGETLDKAGSAAGLPYPAGKAISELARKGNRYACEFPVPYIKNDNLNFSFSGLKTAAVTFAKNAELANKPDSAELADFCASLNYALARSITEKCKRALDKEIDIKVLCAAGGVAANELLSVMLKDLMVERKGQFIHPPHELCMDNGAMIAYAGWLAAKAGYRHGPDFETVPRGRPIPDDLKICGYN